RIPLENRSEHEHRSGSDGVRGDGGAGQPGAGALCVAELAVADGLRGPEPAAGQLHRLLPGGEDLQGAGSERRQRLPVKRMRPFTRVALLLLATATIAACSSEEAGTSVAAAPSLRTLTVAGGDPSGGLTWDGVVQAQDQSVLSAQTSGRVTTLA